MRDSKERDARTPDIECPQCHSSSAVVPIFYGLFKEVPEAVMSGRAVLGGCCVQKERYYCKDCESSFAQSKEQAPEAGEALPRIDEDLPGNFIMLKVWSHCSIEIRKVPNEQKWFVVYRGNDGAKSVAELSRRLEAIRLSELWALEPPV